MLTMSGRIGMSRIGLAFSGSSGKGSYTWLPSLSSNGGGIVCLKVFHSAAGVSWYKIYSESAGEKYDSTVIAYTWKIVLAPIGLPAMF